MATTQADVDTARAAMFAALTLKRTGASLLAQAQATAGQADAAWNTAVSSLYLLPTNATTAQVEAAQLAVETTEAAKIAAHANLALVTQQVADAPGAADLAKTAYITAVNNLINGT